MPVYMHAKYVRGAATFRETAAPAVATHRGWKTLQPHSASHPCLLCRSPCRPPSPAPSKAVLPSWLQLEARTTRKGPPARQGQGTTQTR